jgi:hypothetical protein
MDEETFQKDLLRIFPFYRDWDSMLAKLIELDDLSPYLP